MTDTNETLARLQSRRKELTQRLDAIQRDLGRGLDRDLEEQAIQLENMEVLQEIARVAQQELDEVEQQIAEMNARP